MNKGMTKNELIERYQNAKPLPYKERMAEYNRLYSASKRLYGSWQNFRIEMGDKKKRPRPKSTRESTLLAAVIYLATKSGRKVDVLNCVEAVRRGYADHIKIKECV